MVKQSLRQSIFADPSKCNGCSICELICTEQHERNYGLRTSRIRVMRMGDIVRIGMACRLCENAPCVRACPHEALIQDTSTGVVKVDDEKCNGCGWCLAACDLGLIFFHPTRKVPLMCDLCSDDEPQCIEACQKEALEFITYEAFSSKVKGIPINQLTMSLETLEKAK